MQKQQRKHQQQGDQLLHFSFLLIFLLKKRAMHTDIGVYGSHLIGYMALFLFGLYFPQRFAPFARKC